MHEHSPVCKGLTLEFFSFLQTTQIKKVDVVYVLVHVCLLILVAGSDVEKSLVIGKIN